MTPVTLPIWNHLSLELPNWLAQRPEVSPRAKLVAARLSEAFDYQVEELEVDPLSTITAVTRVKMDMAMQLRVDVADLARSVGMTLTDVIEALQELVGHKLIAVVEPPSTVRLLPHPWMAAQ